MAPRPTPSGGWPEVVDFDPPKGPEEEGQEEEEEEEGEEEDDPEPSPRAPPASAA